MVGVEMSVAVAARTEAAAQLLVEAALRVDAVVAGDADAAVAEARLGTLGDEEELVGEECDAVSFLFTTAMYAAHSRWQLVGSAKANSRTAFINGVSSSMARIWGGGRKNLVWIWWNF